MFSPFVLPSYISSDCDTIENSRAAVPVRRATKRPTVLLGKVQLLRFCTSPAYVARRQGGDFVKIDLAATKKPTGTLAVAVVDLAALLPRRQPPRGRPGGLTGSHPNPRAVADLARPPPRRRRRLEPLGWLIASGSTVCTRVERSFSRLLEG